LKLTKNPKYDEKQNITVQTIKTGFNFSAVFKIISIDLIARVSHAPTLAQRNLQIQIKIIKIQFPPKFLQQQVVFPIQNLII